MDESLLLLNLGLEMSHFGHIVVDLIMKTKHSAVNWFIDIYSISAGRYLGPVYKEVGSPYCQGNPSNDVKR